MMRRNARMKRDVFLADIGTRPLIMGIQRHAELIFRRRPLHCRRRDPRPHPEVATLLYR